MGRRTGNYRRNAKVLLGVGAACIAVMLSFIAIDPSASGYEITIYDSYPGFFWLLVLTAMFLGQIVIFRSANADSPRRYWKWGFVLLLAANTVLLMIPAMRYNLYASADMLTHIGYIRQIRSLGFVPDTNYYPNVHLLALTFASITGIDVPKSITVITPLMSVFYFVAIYVLLTRLFEDHRKTLFVLPFSSLLLFKTQHVVFMPSWFAFLLIPFAFYLLLRSYGNWERRRFKVLLVVTTVSLVFYHPAVTVFFVGMLVLFKLSSVGLRRLSTKKSSDRSTPFIIASISLVLFFSWYYSFRGILGSTLSVVYVLIGIAEGSSRYGSLASTAARTDPQLLDVALVGIYNYGLYAAVVGLSAAFTGYLVYLFTTRREEFGEMEVFLSTVLVTFTAGAAVAFFVDVVLSFYRILRYALFAGSILIGVGFYTLYKRVEPADAVRYVRPTLYASFFILTFLAVFGLYGSPPAADESHQITQAEITGMEWLFDHRNTSLMIDELGISQFRMHTFIRPQEELGRNVAWGSSVPPPPTHFDYGNASARDVLSTASENRRYLVVTQFGRERNPRFYPKYREQWRHDPSDFERLERDPTFAHVYDDGTLDTYIVREVGNASNESRPEV